MKKFIKNVEDFICENCSFTVKGNGFTNHCPECFYSKHVDNNPGDRDCECLGLMIPINFFDRNGEMYITHKCEKCGMEKKNKLSENDNRENMFKMMKIFSENNNKNIATNNVFFKLNKNKKLY